MSDPQDEAAAREIRERLAREHCLYEGDADVGLYVQVERIIVEALRSAREAAQEAPRAEARLAAIFEEHLMEQLAEIRERWDHTKHTEDNLCGETACEDVGFLLELLGREPGEAPRGGVGEPVCAKCGLTKGTLIHSPAEFADDEGAEDCHPFVGEPVKVERADAPSAEERAEMRRKEIERHVLGVDGPGHAEMIDAYVGIAMDAWEAGRVAGRAEEREECAKLAADARSYGYPPNDIASKIRARADGKSR